MMEKTMCSENNIYIVLIKAHTGLGKISRKITKYDYSHISISMDESFTDFVTFSNTSPLIPVSLMNTGITMPLVKTRMSR